MTSPKGNPPEDIRQAAEAALKDFDKEAAEQLKAREAREAEKEKCKTRRLIFQWIIIIVCLGIVGYRLPKLADALSRKAKPLRHGTLATDALTDQCIANLWKVSQRIQEGKPVGADLVCPTSKQPFVVRKIGDDVVIRSPRPELYGFKEIRVSKKKPMPELIK